MYLDFRVMISCIFSTNGYGSDDWSISYREPNLGDGNEGATKYCNHLQNWSRNHPGDCHKVVSRGRH